MSYTLIDYIRCFHILCKTQSLSAGTRSTFTAIIGEFNAAHFPERLSISDRDLKSLAGLKSVASVHECKNVLKNHKLIDFTTKRGCRGSTEYSLPTEWLASINRILTEHLPNINRTLTEHLPNICRTFEPAPNIRAREDLKTEDVKTKNNNNSAGACENLDEVLDYWEELCGGRLTFEHQSQIKAWVNQKGVEWVKEVMQTAADSNNNPRGISFNYFKAIVQNKLNAQAQKPAKTSVADMLKALDEQIKW